MLILRRPWLALDCIISPPFSAHLPYGSVGEGRAELRCGLIPHDHLDGIVQHFEGALPNEAAAFIVWNEHSRVFAVHFPDILDATPSRLVYRSLVLGDGWHMVCDIHSHAQGAAFFSATDDADDAHAVKISLVIGRLGCSGGPTTVSRLCAGGMFLPLPRSPFTGGHDAR